MDDPRPDLTFDSQEWTKLLTVADKKNKDLAGVLHGFRCCGLRLERGKNGYRLRPDINIQTSIWVNKGHYIYDRDKWLVPYEKEITELLNSL